MVNNHNIILDASLNSDVDFCGYKNVAEVIYMPYPTACMELYRELTSLCNEYYQLNSEIKIKSINFKLNDSEKERNRDRMCEILDILPDWTDRALFNNGLMLNSKQHEKLCCEHIMLNTDIKPINPAVMINICPAWKGTLPTHNMIIKFQRAIQQYADECNSSRWEKIQYILEDGPDGDHLHLHGVFHINPLQIKSVETHLKKSKHVRQIQKHMRGCLGEDWGQLNINIQTSILRTENLINDKIAYLDPDNKPLGHENKTKLMEVKTIVFS